MIVAVASRTSSPASASAIGSPSSRTSTSRGSPPASRGPGTPGGPGTRAQIVAAPRRGRRLVVDVPLAAVGELVELQRRRVDRRRSRATPAAGPRPSPRRGRSRGRSRACPAAGRSAPPRPRGRASRAELGVAGLGQQRADRLLGLLVGALAEVDVADLAVGVDQVLRRPVLVRERGPGAELVVLDHRVVDPVLVDRVGDVAGVLLERELGRVHADDRQPVVAVLARPTTSGTAACGCS